MVVLKEQSPGQTALEDFIDVESTEVDPTVAPSSDGADEGNPPIGETIQEELPEEPRRQIIIIPSQFSLNEEILLSNMGEFAEMAFANNLFGGQLYFTRSQAIEVGSALLQIAGKMTGPKELARMQAEAEAKAAAADLSVVVRDTTLVGPDGVSPLRGTTTAEQRV